MLFKIKRKNIRNTYHNCVIADASKTDFKFEYEEDSESYVVYLMNDDGTLKRMSTRIDFSTIRNFVEKGTWEYKGKYNDLW